MLSVTELQRRESLSIVSEVDLDCFATGARSCRFEFFSFRIILHWIIFTHQALYDHIYLLLDGDGVWMRI